MSDEQKARKFLCENYRCQHRCFENEVLQAPDPFSEGAVLHACPACKKVYPDGWSEVCEAVGCWGRHYGGISIDGGPYRVFCRVHYGIAIGVRDGK